MTLLLDWLAFAAGLLLVAAAFIYLVDPREAQQLLRKFRAPLLAVLAVFVAVTVLCTAERLQLFIGLAGASIAAYLIRESRRPKRQHRQSFGGAERTPVLPIIDPNRDEGDTEKKEP